MAHVPPLPGAKAILYHDGALVSLLRDDIPTIPFPNHWDLPGGGVEPGETAIEAVIREIKEETGLLYTTDAFTWRRVYTGRNRRPSHFFAAPISSEQIAAIVLGDEGQAWRMMDCREFAARPDTIPHFRARVSDFFAT